MIEKSDAIAERVKGDFGRLLKLSEKTARKLWGNKEDAIWDNV